jgi:ribosome-binding protein aMBF1 (putative translation factor)
VPAPTNAQLGHAIRNLRKQRGLSIEALAANVAMHWTYLSEIERGLANPSWKVVGKLADELGVELPALAELAAEMPAS